MNAESEIFVDHATDTSGGTSLVVQSWVHAEVGGINTREHE